MSDTFILECNRNNSKVKTDDKLDWINNIDALQLKAGDEISMVKAILNQRGASTQTIEFEEDMEEEILIGYYVMDSGVSASIKNRPWVYQDVVYTTGATSRLANSGHTDSPYPRMKCSNDAHRRLYPILSKVQIKVGKGSYSVSALSDLITQQFSNGVMTEPFDYKVNNTLKTNLLDKGLPYNSGFTDLLLHTSVLNQNGTGDANSEFLVDGQSVKKYYDDYVKDNNDYTSMPNTASTIRDATHTPHSFRGRDPATADANGSLNYSYVGASPSISWDINENRFFLNELHSPYTIPSIDDGATTSNAGSGHTATIFKKQTTTVDHKVSCNPRVATSGVWILNPALLTCKNNGDVDYTKSIPVANQGNIASVMIDVLNNVAGISLDQLATAQWFGLFDADFDNCFSTTALAEDNWKKTLWWRLGFDKDQFGTMNRFKYYYMSDINKEITSTGITTIQDYSIALANASSGLGEDPYVQHSVPVVGYGGDIPNSSAAALVYSEWRIQTATKPLVAQNLPQLSASNSYYNVWTDLVPNHWRGNQGNQMSLISTISLNYSAGDSIYSFDDGIVFTLTEDMVINNVHTRILQPNGVVPPQQFFDDNTTIFYKIVRPIRSFNANLEPLEDKTKSIKDSHDSDK